MSTPVGKTIASCWSVRIPDRYQVKPPQLRELTSLEVEPRGDSGVVQREGSCELLVSQGGTFVRQDGETWPGRGGPAEMIH